MENVRDKLLYFCSIPRLDSLAAICAKYVSNEGEHFIQPPCCRELIFREEDILVAPAFERRDYIYIILTPSKLSDESFILLLRQLSFEIKGDSQVTQELFQYCFTFTLSQRLAPLWNKTGNYFVRGKDFLLSNSKQECIYLEAYVTDKLCLSLEAFLIRMCPPQLSEFLEPVQLNRFLSCEDLAIKEYSPTFDRCCVLPSLKTGKIQSISRGINPDTPFASYGKIRQHWKLMYGYRLPAEDPPFYVNIAFGTGKIFTYPSYCIREHEPVEFNRCDQRSITMLFIENILQRMPSFCGHEPRFTRDAMFPIFDLISAGDKENKCLRKMEENHVNKATKELIVHESFLNLQENSTKTSPAKTVISHIERDNGNKYVPKFTAARRQLTKGRSALSSAPDKVGKLEQRNTSGISDISLCKTVADPQRVTQGISSDTRRNTLSTSSNVERDNIAGASIPYSIQPLTTPIFTKKHKSTSVKATVESKFKPMNITSNRASNVPLELKMTLSRNKTHYQKKTIKPVFNDCSEKPKVGMETQQGSSFPIKNNSQVIIKRRNNGILVDYEPTVSKSKLNSTEILIRDHESNFSSVITTSRDPTSVQKKDFCLLGLKFAEQILVKSKMGYSEVESLPEAVPSSSKKPITARNAVTEADVENLYQENKLKKANMTVLRGWLRSKGVKSSAAEKKEELLKKVEQFLSLHQSEQ